MAEEACFHDGGQDAERASGARAGAGAGASLQGYA